MKVPSILQVELLTTFTDKNALFTLDYIWVMLIELLRNVLYPMADIGEWPGEPPPAPLFLDQTEARRVEKDQASPYLRVWSGSL